MYKIFLERRAEQDLENLDKQVYKRVIARILFLKNNPRPQGVKKLSEESNLWRIRIGDWRVIYDINDKEKIVRIFRIRHRSSAYG